MTSFRVPASSSFPLLPLLYWHLCCGPLPTPSVCGYPAQNGRNRREASWVPSPLLVCSCADIACGCYHNDTPTITVKKGKKKNIPLPLFTPLYNAILIRCFLKNILLKLLLDFKNLNIIIVFGKWVIKKKKNQGATVIIWAGSVWFAVFNLVPVSWWGSWEQESVVESVI